MSDVDIDCVIDRAGVDDAPAMAEIHGAGWEIAYGDVLAPEELEKWSDDDREAMWREVIALPAPPVHTLVARDPDGHVLGFACAGPRRDDAYPIEREIYAIYVDPECWRQGIGSMLFVLTLHALRSEGADRVFTWVPVENDVATDFFEAMGGVAIGDGQSPEGLEQTAFAWRDFAQLLGD